MNKYPSLALLTVLAMTMATGCGEPKRQIGKLADVQNAVIGAMTGTTGEQLAKDRFPQATIKSFDDIMDAVAALKSDQIDAVITGFPAAMNVCKHNSDLLYLDEPVDYENTAIAVKKGNTALLRAVDGIIGELKGDGTLKDMRRRWFKTDLSPYEEVQVSLPDRGEVLKVGTSATREPFCFIDARQQVSGHDGELARRIGARLGRPIEFVDMKFSALIPALQAGKVDLIVAGMTETGERKKSVDFTRSYFENSQRLIVKKPAAPNPGADRGATAGKLKTLDDIANRRVGVYEGTIQDGFVARTYPQAVVSRYNALGDIVLALKTEKIDVAMIDTISAELLLKKNPELGMLVNGILEKPLGIGFSKKNRELRRQFNGYLAGIRADGTYAEVHRRWCLDDPETARMPKPRYAEQGREWKVGVAVADLPYVAYMNGEYVGFDIEILQKFAERRGYRLKWLTMEFPSLIAALASGKVDMISDGIAITAERQKQVDFSDSHLGSTTAVFGLRKNIAAYTGTGTGDSQAPAPAVSFFGRIARSFHSNIVVEKRYLLILDGLKTTLITSILSILFGTLLGGLICFMRMSRRRVLSLSARLYISVLRGTPVLVLLMIIFYVVFASIDIDPVVVAVIAFGMNFAAYVSEMYRTGIEGVDRGQTEAGIAMGFSRIKTFFYIVMPQAVRRILPVYKGEAISLVKMTSIVGYIAVQDLTKASDIIRSRTFDAFFPLIMVAVLYFILAGLLMLLLGIAERRTNPKLKARKA